MDIYIYMYIGINDHICSELVGGNRWNMVDNGWNKTQALGDRHRLD